MTLPYRSVGKMNFSEDSEYRKEDVLLRKNSCRVFSLLSFQSNILKNSRFDHFIPTGVRNRFFDYKIFDFFPNLCGYRCTKISKWDESIQ